MITLAIDGSTYRATVAVLEARTVLAAGEATMRGRHADALMPATAAALASASVAPNAIGRVVCGAGPGSFTSLRIAGAIAKGIAFGTGAPLYPVSSLGLALACSNAPPGSYVIAMDALRDEWYAAVFDRAPDGVVSERRPPTLVSKSDLERFAESVGAGVLQNPSPHASGCVWLESDVQRAGPADVDRWEPTYGRLAEAQVRWEKAQGRALVP